MRVRHSPCSWLKEIVEPDSVAGNTLMGMFTRLIFRKPFHVARAVTGPPGTQNVELRTRNLELRGRTGKRIGHLAGPFRAEPGIGANFRTLQARCAAHR